MKVVVDRVLDTCVAGGVEIQGLHATVAPRRQGQQTPPTLEQFHFVPYKEDKLFSQNVGLSQYLKVVRGYLHKEITALSQNALAGKFEKIDELVEFAKKAEGADNHSNCEEFDKYLQASGCGLARAVDALFKLPHDDKFAENAKDVIESHREELSTDRLLAALTTSERSLKTCLDVVLENSSSMVKLKVVEVGANRGQLYQSVIPQLNTQPLLNIAYTACDKDVSTMDADQLESLGVTSTAAWDLTSDTTPSDVSGMDLLVASNVLSTGQQDVVKTLEKLSAVVKDNGFLLFNEPTQNHLLPMSLSALTNSPFVPMNTASYTDLLKQAQLEIVAQKSDGLLSTLFLCRRRAQPQEEDAVSTLMDVSDLTDFSWVSDLRTALTAHQDAPSGHRLWVVVDGRSESGVVGMVNCLRQEPGGDKLR